MHRRAKFGSRLALLFAVICALCSQLVQADPLKNFRGTPLLSLGTLTPSEISRELEQVLFPARDPFSKLILLEEIMDHQQVKVKLSPQQLQAVLSAIPEESSTRFSQNSVVRETILGRIIQKHNNARESQRIPRRYPLLLSQLPPTNQNDPRFLPYYSELLDAGPTRPDSKEPVVPKGFGHPNSQAILSPP